MKKIGWVTPWFGADISGGAENALREIIVHLAENNVEVEVLSTCVKEFNSDWNQNYYREGIDYYQGILIRRFAVKKRNTDLFDQINGMLLQGKTISREQEVIFVREMINSPDLYRYISIHKDEYQCFVFIPYMFGTTYYGIQECKEKAVMVPCFHEECYLHLNIFKECFEQVKGMCFNALPEWKLANQVFNLQNVKQIIPGLGMNINISGNGDRFRNKYGILDPYIIYAGRKDVGKNIYTLLKYFGELKKRNKTNLKLVLIGGGEIDIAESIKEDVYDLGYIEQQDKYDAYSASLFLCQPSKHESFSYVVMESWLCGRPVLVHEGCEVTKDFVLRSNGGLYFSNYLEFEGCIDYFSQHMDIAAQMGVNGACFVKDNFKWDIVINKYIDFFKKL